MALLSFVESAPRAYRLKVGNADLFSNSTEPGTSPWEAALGGSHLKLSNLLVIVNRNRLQIDGPTESIMTLEPVAEKWKAFGWDVQEVNGHSISEIVHALNLARANAETSACPQILIAHTTKGRGISFMENCPSSDNLRQIKLFEKGGSGSSGVRV
ncbi:hypothetical protein [Bradyrhizobium sp. LeoA1S1]